MELVGRLVKENAAAHVKRHSNGGGSGGMMLPSELVTRLLHGLLTASVAPVAAFAPASTATATAAATALFTMQALTWPGLSFSSSSSSSSSSTSLVPPSPADFPAVFAVPWVTDAVLSTLSVLLTSGGGAGGNHSSNSSTVGSVSLISRDMWPNLLDRLDGVCAVAGPVGCGSPKLAQVLLSLVTLHASSAAPYKARLAAMATRITSFMGKSITTHVANLPDC